MHGRRKLWALTLCVAIFIVISSSMMAENQNGFAPVQVGKDPNEPQLAVVQVIVNKERAFYLECRLIDNKLALPVMALLRELQVGFSAEKDKLLLSNPTNKKNIVLSFKDNIVTVDGAKTTVTGWIGESDYYLTMTDLHYIIGVDPIWDGELQEISITAAWAPAIAGEDSDAKTDRPGTSNLFQPINRLDINLTGRGEGWSYSTSPGWDSGDMNLEWKTYGLVAGGRLILGGEWDWVFEPENKLDYEFTTYRWEKDFDWGRLTLGTQIYTFWDVQPNTWKMRGISFTDLKQWDTANLTTDIVGQTQSGDLAELWMDDYILASTEIKDGSYTFASVWLPQLKPNHLTIVIKDKGQVIDRRSVEYISGEDLLLKGEKRYTFALGETRKLNSNHYDGHLTGVGEWVQGINDDLTIGGFFVNVDDADPHRQGGVNLAWRPMSNFIFTAETWTEAPELSWRLSTDWGHQNVYLLTNYLHRDLGFRPIFPDESETASELNMGQISLNWYSGQNLKGIVSGEYRTEKDSFKDERLKLESNIDFRSGKWEGTGYVSWLRESKTLHEDLEENRVLLSVVWDFLPNQWLEGGADYDRACYEISEDEIKKECWVRWTDQYLSKDRWMLEYDYTDDIYGYEQRFKSKWSHLWTNELTTFAGLGYGWGESFLSYDRWTASCGFQYQLMNGMSIGFGYNWNVRNPEVGAKEYSQEFWLQVSFGVLFGSGGPTIVPNTGEDRTSGVVTGVVYRDVNGNGIRDRNEAGIQGIQVVLDDLNTVVTDNEGRFTLFNVAPGIHRINIDPMNLSVLYNTVERYRTIYVVAGATLKEDLGLQIVAGVSGRVFVDRNANGVYDEGETLLAGVRVQSEKGVWATTGKNGAYYLQLIAGEHSLAIDPTSLPAGYKVGSSKKISVGDKGDEVTGIDLVVLSQN